MKRLVLTGAGGRLGSYLREPLTHLADEVISSDLMEDIGALYPGERYQQADLTDFEAIQALLTGADMVVHFGAIGDEAPFDQILGPNIQGAYHVWEAAYRHGLRRVVYASSIHAVGMYPKDQRIGTEVPHRPDTFYGLSKCFAEDLGRLYWDKRGLESVHLRILSCAQVTSPRALGSWLSYDDLIQLVTRAVQADATGCSIVYGVSNNNRCPVDTSAARSLGFQPKDNAEQFAKDILSQAPAPDPNDPAQTHHGGPFAAIDLGQSGLAIMTIIDDRKRR